jgi:hypothetical protein
MMRWIRLVALAGTIAAALSLAILRVCVEPIFGPSDEDDHFDYAISIARAGHLLAAKNALGSPTADPESAFLQTYSDRPRIYLNTGDRVGPDYGTHQYFRRIDVRSRAELPDARALMNAPGHPNPVLVSMYPFGFYALAAAVIAIASKLSGSLTATFFAARWLSAGLLALTLGFGYGVARELGLSRALALGLTAIVGCFALTTFVASYVQPDNLAATTATAAFYYSLRLRSARPPFEWAALGIALALLAVTKYQTALCVAAAVLPMLAVHVATRRRSWKAGAAAAGAVLSPAALALAIQALVVGRNAAFAASVDSHFHAFGGPGTLGADFAQFCLRCAQGAWYFFIGNVTPPFTHDYRVAAAVSYWNYFGNLDTPVTLVTPAIDRIARATIALLTGAIVLLTLAFLVRAALRLARLAARGRLPAALRLATANTPLNAYFAFCAFMIFFYAFTDNNWRTSGRNFFPFVVPAMLLAVRYAPRALPRRPWRVAFGATTFALLALYASVGTYDAAAAVERRYYGPPHVPPLARLARGGAGAIAFDLVGSGPIEAAQDVTDGVPRVRPTLQGDTLKIDGLAADAADGGSAGGVIAVLDGAKQYAASYGYAHADLARRFRDARLFWAGFRFEIPTANVALGPHRLRFFVVSHDMRVASPVRAAVDADVVARGPERPVTLGEPDSLTGALDSVTTLQEAETNRAGPDAFDEPRDRTLFVRGWLLDVRDRAGVRALALDIDGTRRFAAALGDVRPELPARFPSLAPLTAVYAGFTAAVPLDRFPTGAHRFDLVAVDARGRSTVVLRGYPFATFDPARGRDTIDPPQDPLPLTLGERGAYAASIDQVSPLRDATYWSQGPIWIRRGEFLFVKGWGLDFVHRRNLAPIVVTLDGGARFAAHTGDVRPDVMLGYSNLPQSATGGAGWSVAIPTAALRSGEHEVRVASVDPRTGRPLVLVQRVPFTIF